MTKMPSCGNRSSKLRQEFYEGRATRDLYVSRRDLRSRTSGQGRHNSRRQIRKSGRNARIERPLLIIQE